MLDIGHDGASEARKRYESSGLDYARRSALGLALQALFARVDALAVSAGWEQARGAFSITNNGCMLHMDTPQRLSFNPNED